MDRSGENWSKEVTVNKVVWGTNDDDVQEKLFFLLYLQKTSSCAL